MSLCIANYVRTKIYEKWSTAHRFMRILEQQLMFIHTYFAAAMICSSLSSSFSWDCWLSPNGFRNRIFPSSSEGYLIVFFYLFTSWQDVYFFPSHEGAFCLSKSLISSWSLISHPFARRICSYDKTSHTLKIIWVYY